MNETARRIWNALFKGRPCWGEWNCLTSSYFEGTTKGAERFCGCPCINECREENEKHWRSYLRKESARRKKMNETPNKTI